MKQVAELHPPQDRKTIYHKDWVLLRDAQPVSTCLPVVEVHFKEGKVNKVIVFSRTRGIPPETCGDAAVSALVSKYGRPAISTDKDHADFTLINHNQDYTWVQNGLRIRLDRRNIKTDDTWDITYEAVTDIGL